MEDFVVIVLIGDLVFRALQRAHFFLFQTNGILFFLKFLLKLVDTDAILGQNEISSSQRTYETAHLASAWGWLRFSCARR